MLMMISSLYRPLDVPADVELVALLPLFKIQNEHARASCEIKAVRQN